MVEYGIVILARHYLTIKLRWRRTFHHLNTIKPSHFLTIAPFGQHTL